jgi:hypothetical protein
MLRFTPRAAANEFARTGWEAMRINILMHRALPFPGGFPSTTRRIPSRGVFEAEGFCVEQIDGSNCSMNAMKSRRGKASAGKDINPAALSDQAETSATPRSAPAPGLPISEEEYNRLKKAAALGSGPRVNDAREDTRKKKRKHKPRNC